MTDFKLSRNSNTDVIYSKGRLRQYGVDTSLITLLYRSFMSIDLLFCRLVWLINCE